MNYKDLIKLGFKRFDTHDSVHVDEYGWHNFFVTKKLSKRHELIWDPTERDRVTLNKYKTDGHSIEKQWIIKDLSVVGELVRMFN